MLECTRQALAKANRRATRMHETAKIKASQGQQEETRTGTQPARHCQSQLEEN